MLISSSCLTCHVHSPKKSEEAIDQSTLDKLNSKIMYSALIEEHAKICQKTDLQASQTKLLKVVLLSRTSERVKVAATNAMMILQATFFSFYGLNLSKIKIPGARFHNSIFDKVDFRHADLSNVEFINCSFRAARFDHAMLENVNFGSLPYLEQKEKILAASIAPELNLLASNGASNLYLWDLVTGECIEKAELRKKYSYESIEEGAYLRDYPCSFLIFSSDRKFLIKAFGPGLLEVWQTSPLKILSSLFNPFRSFRQLEETIAGELLTVAELNSGNEMEITLWEQDSEKQGLLKWKNSSLITGSVLKTAFSMKGNILAVVVQEGGAILLRFFSYPQLIPIEKSHLLSESNTHRFDIKFTPDGEKILISKDENLYAIDPMTMQKEFLFSESKLIEKKKENHFIADIQFLAGCDLLGYNSQNTTPVLSIRDPKNNFAEVTRINGMTYKNSPIFLSDSQRIFKAQGYLFETFPLARENAKQLLPFNTDQLGVTFDNQTGSLIALNTEGELYHYSSISGECTLKRGLNEHKLDRYAPHFGSYWYATMDMPNNNYCICHLSNNGKYLIRGWRSYQESTLAVSKAEDGNLLLERKFDQACYCFGITEDGRSLLIAFKDRLLLSPIDSDQIIDEISFDFSEHWQSSMMISDNLKSIALMPAPSEGRNAVILKVDWDKKKVNKVADFGARMPAKFFGEQFLYLTHNMLELWSENEGEKVFYSTNDYISSSAISSDQSNLYYAKRYLQERNKEYEFRIKMYDLRQRKKLDSFSFWDYQGIKLQLSPCNQFLAAWSSRKIYMLNVSEKKFRLLWKIPSQFDVWKASFSGVKNLAKKNCKMLFQKRASIKQ